MSAKITFESGTFVEYLVYSNFIKKIQNQTAIGKIEKRSKKDRKIEKRSKDRKKIERSKKDRKIKKRSQDRKKDGKKDRMIEKRSKDQKIELKL